MGQSCVRLINRTEALMLIVATYSTSKPLPGVLENPALAAFLGRSSRHMQALWLGSFPPGTTAHQFTPAELREVGLHVLAADTDAMGLSTFDFGLAHIPTGNPLETPA
jgi:hypothetical protein